MSNIILHFTVISIISLISCSQENELPIRAEDSMSDTVCTIDIELYDSPDTRTTLGVGEYQDLDVLFWSLFEVETDASGNVSNSKFIGDFDKPAFNSDQTSESISLRLNKEKKYQLAIMAKYRHSFFTSLSEGIMNVDYSKFTEWPPLKHDVFVGKSTVIIPTDGFTKTVTLKRPFAQINWGTSDLGVETVNLVKNKIENKAVYDGISGSIYTSLDIIANKVSNSISSEFSFSRNSINTNDYTFPSSGSGLTYNLFSMAYILVNQTASSTIKCKMVFSNGCNAEVEVDNVPVQANYRTNIYGALLTNPNLFWVDVTNGFEDFSNTDATPE